MLIAIKHDFMLANPVPGSRLLAHLLLTPRDTPTQRVRSWKISGPGLDDSVTFNDAFGNPVRFVSLNHAEAVSISIDGLVETIDGNGVIGLPLGEPMPALYKRITPQTRSNPTIHNRFRSGKGGRIAVLHSLMALLGEINDVDAGQSQSQSQNGQEQNQSTADAPPDAEKLTLAFIGAARALDIPARFVTGYLLSEDPKTSGPHVWAEAMDERLGWIAFDPLLQLCPTDRHVRVAVGLDAASTPRARTVPDITPVDHLVAVELGA